MNDIQPEMVKCSECIYAKPYFDVFLGRVGHRCNNMRMIGEFGDEYSLQNTACVEGIKKAQPLQELSQEVPKDASIKCT